MLENKRLFTDNYLQQFLCLDDNILADCKHSITDPDTIVRSYEVLDADRKASVLNKYYLAAKTLLKERLNIKSLRKLKKQDSLKQVGDL